MMIGHSSRSIVGLAFDLRSSLTRYYSISAISMEAQTKVMGLIVVCLQTADQSID